MTQPQHGPVYSDSDVYKWTEAVGFVLQSGDRPDLRASAEKAISEVVAVQEPSGYLNTYYVDDRKSLRMQPQTQTTGHELYNIGHMLQGAIAYYRGTGDRKLLDAGIRFVDDFLIPNYGPAPKKPIVSGHPEIEMALIELYRITGDKRQLDLAGYILQGDKRIELPERRTIYMFCGTPFTERTKLEGHAVRAMYACCGATDYYMETGDDSYWQTLNKLWTDMTSTKMYVTGGVGSRADGEAFGDAYELPNFRAYGESCAAIGNMMWNWRMLAATGEAKFTDVIERALYNGINSGMSLDGVMYCYRNPLAFDPSGRRQNSQSLVRHYLLSTESGAHFRIIAGIFLQHQQRRDLRTSLRQFGTGLAFGEWHGPEDHAEDKLSMGRKCRDDGEPVAAGRFRGLFENSWMGR